MSLTKSEIKDKLKIIKGDLVTLRLKTNVIDKTEYVKIVGRLNKLVDELMEEIE